MEMRHMGLGRLRNAEAVHNPDIPQKCPLSLPLGKVFILFITILITSDACLIDVHSHSLISLEITLNAICHNVVIYILLLTSGRMQHLFHGQLIGLNSQLSKFNWPE